MTLYGFGNGSRLSPYYYYKDFHKTDYDYLHRPEAYHGFRSERQALQRWHAMGAITWVLDGTTNTHPKKAVSIQKLGGVELI